MLIDSYNKTLSTTEEPTETPEETETTTETTETTETTTAGEKKRKAKGKAKKDPKKEKAPRITVKMQAEERMKKVPDNLYTVDTKGRYRFAGFYLVFQKDRVRLCPGKTFRKNHSEIAWESHPGWANEFSTAVPWSVIENAINELLATPAEETTETPEAGDTETKTEE